MTYVDYNEHVFVLGSARSGTSLMASILESSPLYAKYRAETKLLNRSKSKYGLLDNASSRSRFLNDWFQSRQFRRTGLTNESIEEATRNENSYIGFLGIYMNMVAQSQGCLRWVDSTPDNANCLPIIATTFPNAKVIHMIRDGRAVAMSLAKLGWAGVRTSNIDKALIYSALKWQRTVDRVYSTRHCLGGRYLQIKYEDLVERPAQTLTQVSEFLQIGAFDISMFDGSNSVSNESVNSSLRTPNSLFGDMEPGISTNAAYRWKTNLEKRQIEMIEMNIGDSLEKYSYDLLCNRKLNIVDRLISDWRKALIKLKDFLRHYTRLGRLAQSSLEIDKD